MKKYISIFILFLSFSLHAQQPEKDFYYYKGEKIFLSEKSDKILVKIAHEADKQSLWALIKADETVNSDALDEELNLHILLKAKEGMSFTIETLLKYRENPNVKSAQFMLEYEKNLLIGLMDEFIIKLKTTTKFEQLQNLIAEHRCVVVRENTFVKNQYVISVSKQSELNAMQMANLFYETALFEFSKPNFVIINALTSSDPLFNQQWALHNTYGGIRAENAWTITQGSLSVKIALIDVGVDLDHPDLSSNLLSGHDATGGGSGGGFFTVDDNHGTACAGIISAIKDNNKGISGVAPSCKLIPIKMGNTIFGGFLDTTSEWLANSIRWAYLNGADVISNSWEANEDDDITNAINEAVSNGRNGKGCVFVFASGNENRTTVTFPARLSNVLSVGATSWIGQRAGFSNYGNDLDVVAPGESIYTTDRQGGSVGYNHATKTASELDTSCYESHRGPDTPYDYYCCFTGTSASCPHVAGIAALILSVNYLFTWNEVKDIIESSARKVWDTLYHYSPTQGRPNGSWTSQMGYGLVDAYTAVATALGGCYHGLPVVQGNITQNTTWNTSVHVRYGITIPNGITLTISDTVKCESNVSFIIQPGGKLVVDGGVFTSACEDELWQGIYLSGNTNLSQTPQNQGVLELKNGAVIENAQTAIATYHLYVNGNINYYSSGGIINADNATFRNNRQSVEFIAYPHIGINPVQNNASYFNNCKFVVNDNNHFASHRDFESHISMWAVPTVQITGCEFENNITNMPNRGRAIFSVDGGYAIDQSCKMYQVSMNDPCPYCILQAKPSVFKGFNKAIESSLFERPYTNSIQRSSFQNNITGIELKGMHAFQISELDMELNTPHNNFPLGIHLNNCNHYKIEGNEIYSGDGHLATGILVFNPGANENQIYRNHIYSTQCGIKVGLFCSETSIEPILRSFPLTGLQFLCNDLENNINDIHVCNSNIRATQGAAGKGADNLFSSNATFNFYCDSPNNTVNYYYDPSVSRKYPARKTVNIMPISASASSCGSTLCEQIISMEQDDEKSSHSPLETYWELNRKFSEMMNIFYEKGYDDILNDYINGIIENEELLKEAIAYHEKILEITEYMAKLSRIALFNLKTDSFINLYKIRDWYEEIYTLDAKYSLAETYYQLGEFEEGFNTLALISEKYNLNEIEMLEHNNYVSLYDFKNKVRESGRTIAQLDKEEINQVLCFAEASSGLSSVMARGILCFFYDICLEDEIDEAEGNDKMMISPPPPVELKGVEKDEMINQSGSSVGEVQALENILLVPNPTTGELTITNCELLITGVEVFDIYGRRQKAESRKDNVLGISNLSSGLYFVKIKTELGEVVKKVIKQ